MIDAAEFETLKRRIDEAEDEARKAFVKLRSYVATFEAEYREPAAPPVAAVVAPPPRPEPLPEPAPPAAEDDQPSLFGDAELPVPESREPVQSIYVHFERLEDIAAFGDVIGVQLGVNTRQITFPPDDMFRKTRPAPAIEDPAF